VSQKKYDYDPHADEQADPNAKPFLAHLEDLRKTLLRALGALVVGMCVAFPFTNKIMDLLYYPLTKNGYDPQAILVGLGVTSGIKTILTVGLWSGVILAAPFIIFFICQFVFPGLLEKEKKVLIGSSGFALLLFMVGVLLCYFQTLPFAIKVMFKFADWIKLAHDTIRIEDYLAFNLKLMLGFGIAFELPEVLYVLGYLGLVNSRQLREKRRHVAVGLLVLAMMLTPPDPGTQLMLALPLFVLFEVCIWLIYFKEKKDGSHEEIYRKVEDDDDLDQEPAPA
jgi:sec-independent protein translocase protein TatC